MTTNEHLEDETFDEAAIDAAINEYHANMKAATDKLESTFADRGLAFTIPFTGSIPNVAYGKLDGLRFYFKFRGDGGSLRVGSYDETLAEQEYQEILSVWNANTTTFDNDDDDFPGSMGSIFNTPPPRRVMDEDRILPNRILWVSEVDNFTGDPYNSSLNTEEAIRIFTKLVTGLMPVSE